MTLSLHTIPAHEGTAMDIRMRLRAARVLAVQLDGCPGSGKTSVIDATIRQLGERARVAAIVAHRAAERDADQLRRCAVGVVPVETSHLKPQHVCDALDRIDLAQTDILLIETPEEEPIDLGESIRVALFSVTGGDDKAAEFPRRVAGADLVLLNKTDLLPMVKFDPRLFRADVISLNPAADLIEISTRDGAGMEQWIHWLLEKHLFVTGETTSGESMPEWWFG